MSACKTLSLVSALGFLLAGCGPTNTGPNLKVTSVRGKMTMKGAPLADADLGFIPLDTPPKGFTSAGAKTDAQGNFEATTGTQKGLPAGNYKVTVSKLTDKDGKPVEIKEGIDIGQAIASGDATNAVPAEYTEQATSTFNLTVVDGKAITDAKFEIP